MNSPFIFGKPAKDNYFINRENESQRLKININSGINTTLISQRRWGKTSLVKKAIQELTNENKNIKSCFIDLFNIKNEEEFYATWIREIIKSTASKTDEFIKIVRSFLKNIIPYISFGIDTQSEINIKFEFADIKNNTDEILDLPEKIATKKNIRFVICIDEFQKITQFNDSLDLQQKLRAKWQHFNNTSFCLYGSKRHVITELFENHSMPFYRFGDTIYLKKIEQKYWLEHINKCFENTGRVISEEIILNLLNICDNHPYYIQQLAHQLWINTASIATNKILNDSVEELLDYNSVMYIREIDNLTSLQIGFINAVINNEEQIFSKEVIKKYKLGTTGNIQRIKSSLENKEIIDFFENKPNFIDPLFRTWFLRKYLNKM